MGFGLAHEGRGEGRGPGLAKNPPVDRAAGEYTFKCKLSGHGQLGRKGTLTVPGSRWRGGNPHEVGPSVPDVR